MTEQATVARLITMEPATFRSPSLVQQMGDSAPRIPFPIYLIEHSNGLVLFDAGLDPDYVGDPSGAYGEMAERIDMRFDERHLIETHLDWLGYSLADISTVVASHLHFDHAGALKRFPHSRTIVGAGEFDYARAPERFSSTWFREEDFHERHGLRFEEIAEDLDLMGDGSITILRLPGHTPGSLGVRVGLENRTIILSGDAVHNRSAYDAEIHYHGDVDSITARATLRRLAALTQEESAELWIAHDPDDWERFGGAGTIR